MTLADRAGACSHFSRPRPPPRSWRQSFSRPQARRLDRAARPLPEPDLPRVAGRLPQFLFLPEHGAASCRPDAVAQADPPSYVWGLRLGGSAFIDLASSTSHRMLVKQRSHVSLPERESLLPTVQLYNSIRSSRSPVSCLNAAALCSSEASAARRASRQLSFNISLFQISRLSPARRSVGGQLCAHAIVNTDIKRTWNF